MRYDFEYGVNYDDSSGDWMSFHESTIDRPA